MFAKFTNKRDSSAPVRVTFAELLFQSVGVGRQRVNFSSRNVVIGFPCNNSRGTLKAWCGLRGSRGCLWHLRGKTILVEASYRFQTDSLRQKIVNVVELGGWTPPSVGGMKLFCCVGLIFGRRYFWLTIFRVLNHATGNKVSFKKTRVTLTFYCKKHFLTIFTTAICSWCKTRVFFNLYIYITTSSCNLVIKITRTYNFTH